MKTFNTAFPYFPESDVDAMLSEIRAILMGEKMLTMGEHVKAFEKEFGSYCGSEYAVATNSCTSALELSLAALGVASGDEVIVPVQTFIATGSCVLKSGAKIVFCDTDDDFLLDFEAMKKLITERTKAVIIVHFAGMISRRIFEIKNYLQERSIALIEDAAHAHGASHEGVRAGSIGDFGCFSFYSTKIMTTGEGGMITTGSPAYYEKCASMRSRGMDINHKGELFVNLGSNHRVTEIQALMGRTQLRRLDEFNAHRNAIASVYRTALAKQAANGTIRFQNTPENGVHAYWRFLVFLNKHDRDKIKNGLNELNIKADAPYSPLLHNQPVFRNDGTIVCKKAESLAAAHISLPIHMLISENDAEYIAVQLAGLLDA